MRVVDEAVLAGDFVPASLPGRDPQMKELEFCLAPCIKKDKPFNALLFGRPGTGKTATARYVLSQLVEKTPADGLYINCWQAPSLHSILEKIMQGLRILNGFQQNTAIKLEKLEKKLDSQLVLVLDEIDWPSPRETNAILYNLHSIEKIGLVLICSSRNFILSLDERVKSRISPITVEFPPYSGDDLVQILRQRADFGLSPQMWNIKILRKIADIAGGDARVAIKTLHNAALVAEKEGKSIRGKHIKEAWQHAKNIKKVYTLERLTIHHKLLYQIIQNKENIASSLLLREYLKRCKTCKIKPISKRTYYMYVNDMLGLNLIKGEMRERQRVFSIGLL